MQTCTSAAVKTSTPCRQISARARIPHLHTRFDEPIHVSTQSRKHTHVHPLVHAHAHACTHPLLFATRRAHLHVKRANACTRTIHNHDGQQTCTACIAGRMHGNAAVAHARPLAPYVRDRVDMNRRRARRQAFRPWFTRIRLDPILMLCGCCMLMPLPTPVVLLDSKPAHAGMSEA